MQVRESEAYDELKKAAEFFGESFDALDPSRILRIVRDFMRLFDKATKEIQVRCESLAD